MRQNSSFGKWKAKNGATGIIESVTIKIGERWRFYEQEAGRGRKRT
jgi:hypothetical protein